MCTTLIGIVSALVSGLLNGSFAAPMKRMSKWQWENIWLIWAVWALVIVPMIIAWATVPDLLKVYRAADYHVLLKTFLLGAGWGAGAVTFGIGLYMVGLSLGYSIIMGVTAVAGSLIPMLIFNPDKVATGGGIIIILGMVLTIAGVALCGRAGMIKEKHTNSDDASGAKKRNMFKYGLLVCLSSGILNSLLNLAFVFGTPIADTARNYLSDAALINFRASNAIWVLALLGAFITNLLYCGSCLLVNRSWRNYTQSQTGIYWFYAFLMGTLWMTGVALYGAGASSLGKLGATVAWIILMATTVLIGNIWGIVSGEWKDAPKKAHKHMAQGLLLLIIAILLVSLGNYISQ
jgi:L-rhamnose-H+ transport protein